MPWLRRHKTNAVKVAGTAGGAVVGGGVGTVGAGLLTKGAAAGSGLLLSGGLPAAATAASGVTAGLLTTVPLLLPIAGVLLGGLGAYAALKNLRL
jgi:hypothetical protein